MFDTRSISAWLHVVRAFECASVVCVSIPLVILPVYMYIALGMYYKCMMGCMSLLSILSSKYIICFNHGFEVWVLSYQL